MDIDLASRDHNTDLVLLVSAVWAAVAVLLFFFYVPISTKLTCRAHCAACVLRTLAGLVLIWYVAFVTLSIAIWQFANPTEDDLPNVYSVGGLGAFFVALAMVVAPEKVWSSMFGGILAVVASKFLPKDLLLHVSITLVLVAACVYLTMLTLEWAFARFAVRVQHPFAIGLTIVWSFAYIIDGDSAWFHQPFYYYIILFASAVVIAILKMLLNAACVRCAKPYGYEKVINHE